ncbi:MAG: hypothetical protein C5S47_05265 [Candidatus Methanogasteraceae archaeon]|nr:MAG: hypothetical protein C5S47_05265 [ANME-2 cluster archaeon]
MGSILHSMNHVRVYPAKITQSAKQRRSHLHKIFVLISCNLVVIYADVYIILSKYSLHTHFPLTIGSDPSFLVQMLK